MKQHEKKQQMRDPKLPTPIQISKSKNSNVPFGVNPNFFFIHGENSSVYFGSNAGVFVVWQRVSNNWGSDNRIRWKCVFKHRVL